MHNPKDSQNTQKVVVITGAASGLGLALTKECLSRGMAVVMADIDKQRLLQCMEELIAYKTSLLTIHCDVSQPEALTTLAQKTFAHFKRVDWVFNNAGISGPLAPIWDLAFKDIEHVFSVNIKSIIHSIQAFIPILSKQKHRSHVINIGSVYGLCSGSLVGAYAMTKHALLALSESLYFDCQRLSMPIDVSVACPSFFNTALLQDSVPTDKKFSRRISALLSHARPAEEIAMHIIQQVEKNVFYILPDREVKDYCLKRTQAIITQEDPYPHTLEKMIAAIAPVDLT